MSIKFTIGADPEFFLMDMSTGQYVSAHDKVPGNKKKPERLPDGSHVQADGTAVEFNIEPSENSKEFADKIRSAIYEIRKIVPNKYDFAFKPVVYYTDSVFKSIPDYAKELGCDPDFCGRFNDIRQNKVPDNIGRRRTGSGHIHIGWTKDADTKMGSDHFNDCVALINDLEFMYSSVKYNFDPHFLEREGFYGAPYSFRPKSYGVEYRSPSNVWVNDSDLCKYMFDMCMEGAHRAAKGLNPVAKHIPVKTWR